VEQRIKYKLCTLCFKVISGDCPKYLSELLTVYTPSRSLRSSADTRLLKVMCYNRKQHGARSFCCAAPPLWNALPHSLRHASSLTAFKHNLKTYLFSEYFG
jgi:hypothetical protein